MYVFMRQVLSHIACVTNWTNYYNFNEKNLLPVVIRFVKNNHSLSCN